MACGDVSGVAVLLRALFDQITSLCLLALIWSPDSEQYIQYFVPSAPDDDELPDYRYIPHRQTPPITAKLPQEPRLGV